VAVAAGVFDMDGALLGSERVWRAARRFGGPAPRRAEALA